MEDSKIGKERLKEIIDESFKAPPPPASQYSQKVSPPKDWQDLQVKVKEIYANLGCAATDNVFVKGARTKHQVDVLAKFEFGGQTYRTVIECKYWNTRVKKSQVATLLGVLADIGAEKGIIVSKKGFQAGAQRLATYTNISLVTYDELRRDSTSFVEKFRLSNALERLQALDVPFSKFMSSMTDEAEKIGEWWYPSKEGYCLLGAISILKSKIESLDSFSYPKGFIFVSIIEPEKEVCKSADCRTEYINLIIENISRLEKEFDECRNQIFSE